MSNKQRPNTTSLQYMTSILHMLVYKKEQYIFAGEKTDSQIYEPPQITALGYRI